MADRNWEHPQHHAWYRHRYGGGYSEDRNRVDSRGYGGAAYDSYDENGYIQDVGREYTDMEGRQGRFFTGASGRDYASGLEDRETEGYGPARGSRNRNLTQGGQEGPHRGKGPRNYQRSQERIHEDVCDRLTDDAMIDATNVDVRVQNDEVILSGTVHNREEKRRVEDLAESVAGVRNVENNLKVQSGEDSGTSYYREYDEQGNIKRSSW